MSATVENAVARPRPDRTRTPRLLIVTRDDPATVRGGVETFCRHLRAVFPGSSVTSYAGAAGGGRWLNEARDARAALRRVEEAVRRERPDAIVANGAAAWAWARREDLPPVLTVYHGTYAGYGRMLARREPLHGLWTCLVGAGLERRAGRGRACVAVSEGVASEARRHYGVDAVPIVNAVDLRPDEGRRPRERSRFRVLFVGRPTWSKGFDLLCSMARRRPEWEWLGAGVPADADPAVRGLGSLEPRAVLDWYGRVDAVVVPSRYEGCSYVPLEAMAAGTPVVASAVGSFDRVGRSPFGHVVPKESEDAALEALEEVRRDPGAFSPKEWVGRHHGFERFSRSWRSLIEENCP